MHLTQPELRRALGTTITADDGSYVVDIGTYTGNILVEVKKGTYIDEATLLEKTNQSLRAAVTQVKGSAVVMVTPFTEIAVRTAGALTTDNIENANALAGTMAGGADIIGTRPADVLNAEECANAASYEIDYGLALAALSSMVKEAHAANIPDAMEKISNDLKDGKLDTHGVHLKDSFLAFLENPNNKSGVTDPDQTEIDDSIVFFLKTLLWKTPIPLIRCFVPWKDYTPHLIHQVRTLRVVRQPCSSGLSAGRQWQR